MTAHPNDDGPPVKAVGQVQVVMLADGQILTTATVPSRNVAVMMLEVAKLDLDQKFREQARSQLVMPPAGFQVPRAGGG